MLLPVTASPDNLSENGLLVAEWVLIFDLLNANLNLWLSSYMAMLVGDNTIYFRTTRLCCSALLQAMLCFFHLVVLINPRPWQ